VRWLEDGVLREMATATPTAAVGALAARFAPHEVPGLQVVRPSLEDVYLSLIGQADLAGEVDDLLATTIDTQKEAVR
jgi:ABC-2 type transport system ATP-binding protein